MNVTDSSNVIQIDRHQQTVVEALEELLVEARAGRITCMIAAVTRTGSECASTFCPGDGVITALGELRVAEVRALEWLREVNGGRL
jgi:predicted amidohydrolase